MVYNSVKYVQIGKKIGFFIRAHFVIYREFHDYMFFYGTAGIWWFTWYESKGFAETVNDFPSHPLPLATHTNFRQNRKY